MGSSPSSLTGKPRHSRSSSWVPVSPAHPIAPRLIDRIDTEPPLTAAFAEHAAAVTARGLALLYRDRQSESKTLLKLALRLPASHDWRLDLREPAGSPLALLAREDGDVDCAWAATPGLYLRAGRASVEVLQAGIQPVGRASTAAALRAFTVFDGTTQRLWWFRLPEGPPQAGWIEGPGPVHASAERAGEAQRGLLAVAAYDAPSRKLALWEEQPGGRFSRTTVTVCEGTREVFLAPWRHGYVIIYDEQLSQGAGQGGLPGQSSRSRGTPVQEESHRPRRRAPRGAGVPPAGRPAGRAHPACRSALAAARHAASRRRFAIGVRASRSGNRHPDPSRPGWRSARFSGCPCAAG